MNESSTPQSYQRDGNNGMVPDVGEDLLGSPSQSRRWEDRRYYDWRTYWRGDGIVQFLRWVTKGYNENAANETDQHIRTNLRRLAHLVKLLREYYAVHGMPNKGGPADQKFVLRELLRDLYAGGSPIWSLELAMKRVAEGLSGQKDVDFFVLPRKAFIFSSESTDMFRITRGFDMNKFTNAERILVQIASYASNVEGVGTIPTRNPEPGELYQAYLTETSGFHTFPRLHAMTEEEMTHRILKVASGGEGLFFFINSANRPEASDVVNMEDKTGLLEGEKLASSDWESAMQFWEIEEHLPELFARLATIEAIAKIEEMDKKRRVLYSPYVLTLFRFVTSAGACGFWFNGGWVDMGVAGVCGALVGLVSTWGLLSKEERLILEIVASLLIGMVAGVVSLLWPEKACFGAIGVAGVIDLLQGFRAVYSVIELMSKHSVSGGADFLESLLFTGLIAYFLKLGQYIAETLTGKEQENKLYLQCNNKIDEAWYILLVPVTSLCWSGLFNPKYKDLPWMCFHGVLAYTVSWACAKGDVNADFSLFLAAMSVTFSSGLVSRFTGRQAMGNTVSGLYVLLPGAYLVRSMFESLSLDFLGTLFFNAAIIGVGAWTGTILCSPTVLGTTLGLLRRQTLGGISSHRRHDFDHRKPSTGAMLFF